MPQTTIRFQKGAVVVILPAPIPGSKPMEVKHQASFLTASGTRIVYDKGVDRYELDLDFQSLSLSELESLQSFFHETVDGVVETFFYIDTNEALHTARFLDPTLEPSKVAYGVYDVHLKLELGDFPK